MSSSFLYLRYSTPDQADGQSELRQTKVARKWCEEHGSKLVKIFKDLGVSGGKKKEERKGLSELMGCLGRGEVPQYLLTEDVDRLSRMLPLDSLNLFNEILQTGVAIVSLRDGQILTRDNWQSSQSFLILTLKTTLANEERQKRIFRGRHNWKQKRLEAAAKIYTRKVPGWLRVEGDKIIPIPERVATVEKMFKMANGGYGIISIIRRFNEEKEPSFFGNDWNKAIIHNTLTSEAVLGHFQPKTNINGKRVEDGDKILNYFPRIIEPELFYAVQAKLKQRNKYRGAGFRYTRQPGQNNLFAGLIKCAKCGASLIHLVRSRHGYSYLVCGNAHKHKKCDYKTVRTNVLEEIFTLFLESPMFSHAYQKPTNTADATRAQIDSVQKQLAKYLSLIEEADGLPPKAILKKIRDFEASLEELETTLRRNLAEDAQALHGPAAFDAFCENIRKDLKTREGRVKLASLIKDFVERIVVDPERCTLSIHWAFDRDVDRLRWSKKFGEFWYIDSQGYENGEMPLYTLWSVVDRRRRNHQRTALTTVPSLGR